MLNVQTTFLAVVDEWVCAQGRGECRRACLPACPTSALLWVTGEDVLLLDRWACEGCGSCLTACPPRAISLHTRRVG